MKSLASVTLALCITAQAHADFSVTNGVQTGSFPAVVALRIGDNQGLCSGTVVGVNPPTVITASHCLENEDTGGITIFRVSETGEVKPRDTAGLVPSTKVFVKPGQLAAITAEFNDETARKDLAVLVFPAGVAGTYAKMAAAAPAADDPVILVGFGDNNNILGTGATQKRFGVNTLAALQDGLLIIQGLSANTLDPRQRGQLSASGHGDSGGPMFNAQQELVGVVSGGGVNEEGKTTGFYVDLYSAESQALLHEARDNGADITGL